MQCASSTTSIPAVAASFGSTRSRKPGLFNRSGLTSSTSIAPAAISAYVSSHSSTFAELTVRARMPARAAASIWLRIRARGSEMKQRDRVAMTAEKIAAFLAEFRKVQLATINQDGTPHLVAMYYVMLDEQITFWTYRSSQKARNLA